MTNPRAEASYTFRLGDLPKLDLQIDKGTDFTAWRLQWKSYCSLSGLSRQDPSRQVEALTLCFSRETLAVVQNLGLTDGQRKDVEAIIEALQRYVDGHLNETVERRNFRRRRQQSGESFDDYLISLRELAKTCKFCSDVCLEKNIRDQVIEGVCDGDTVEGLLQENDLLLAKTVAICRSKEAAKRHRSDITGPDSELVAALHQPQQSTHHIPACPGCGAAAHRGGRHQCPAYNRTCAHCHKVGHFAKVCRGRQVHPLPSRDEHQPSARTIRIQSKELSQQQHLQLYMVQEAATEPAPTITVQVSSSTGTRNLDVLPDSGADISAAGQEVLEFLGQHVDNILPSHISPRTVNGLTMTPLGKVPVTITLGKQMYQDNLHIYPGVSGALISWKAAKSLGILSKSYPYPDHSQGTMTQDSYPTMNVNQVDGSPATDDLVNQFPTVFDGHIHTMDGEKFSISLQEDAVPFCVKTPRSIPFAYRDKLKTELDLLQEQGIITPVTQATEWCAPIVVAPKKGSDKIRMCVDLSHLNRYVWRERYQSPTPAEAVADITADEAKYFTIINAAKGYHQCPLDEASQLYTTFITPFGRFRYLRAPYGLSSIAEHYNRRMAEAFDGLTGFRRVVDDVIIYDKDIESHVEHVKQFLQRCQEQQISINKDK